MKRHHRTIHLCSWDAGLGFMKKGDWRFPRRVLRVLHKAGRFSIFEATANQTIAKTMTMLVKEKLIEVDNSPGYPWSNVKLTEKGREVAEV